MEVNNFDYVLPVMRIFELQKAWYAVYYKIGTKQYYFHAMGAPKSGYIINQTTHFKILGERNGIHRPDAEAAICRIIYKKKR